MPFVSLQLWWGFESEVETSTFIHTYIHTYTSFEQIRRVHQARHWHLLYSVSSMSWPGNQHSTFGAIFEVFYLFINKVDKTFCVWWFEVPTICREWYKKTQTKAIVNSRLSSLLSFFTCNPCKFSVLKRLLRIFRLAHIHSPLETLLPPKPSSTTLVPGTTF
jgi:hypothetical protein